MSDRGRTRHQRYWKAVWASVVSAICFLRGLPLFFRAAPKTPLRVLGIIALDTLHVLRYSQPLPRKTISDLALFLDLAGYANAAWDHKRPCEEEYQAIRCRLESADLGARTEAYLGRLQELESGRPSISGGGQRFDEVRSYREAVARLSLATAADIAFDVKRRESGDGDVCASHCDSDVDTLFRILMQCQIIDDILDYREDVSASLPSFLTAASLPLALALTATAAHSYAEEPERSSGDVVFPLRVALRAFTAATTLVVRVADQRHRTTRQFAHR